MNLDLEKELISKGYSKIIGIDEAGVGALAGDLIVAAVRVPLDFDFTGIKDSKKLTERQRELLFSKIVGECDYQLIKVSPAKIDEINILQARLQAADRLAVAMDADYALIDGPLIPKGSSVTFKPIIKGDNKIVSIACASIIAKVFRDNLMRALHKEFPEYKWNKNKGYGTIEHRQAIEKFGITKYHRKSYKGVING